MSGDLETIEYAAIKRPDGSIYVSHLGHFDALLRAMDATPDDNDFEEGFVTSWGRFVDRNEAYDIAVAAKQSKPSQTFRAPRNGKSELSSEDLFALKSESLLRSVAEDLNYDTLFALSEPKRVLRSQTVRMPALDIEAYKDSQYFYFNCKSFPSTTGKRHKGYIKFKAPDDPNTPLEKVDCVVDCDCQDYRYRWAWANNQRDASPIESDSLNQCIDRAPRVTNPAARPGLCKHLLALRSFLYGQDSHFIPSDDAEDENSRRSKLVNTANKSRLDSLVKVANGATIDIAGNKVKSGPKSDTVPAGPDDDDEVVAGPVPPSNDIERERELRRRQQVRARGGNPDVAPPRTNPTNSTNPRNKSNKQNGSSQENIVKSMENEKLLQEVIDSEAAAMKPSEKPGDKVISLLQRLVDLSTQLVELNKQPAAKPEDDDANADISAGPDEPPVAKPAEA